MQELAPPTLYGGRQSVQLRSNLNAKFDADGASRSYGQSTFGGD